MTETEAPTKKLIFNFLPALTDSTVEAIQNAIGPHTVALIRPYLGLNASIGEQVTRACRLAVERYGRPDYIIPPGNSMAAIYVDRYFSTVDGFPPCLVYVPLIRLVPLAGPDAWAFGGVEE